MVSCPYASLAGCPEAALANISRAVSCAVEHGALGVVVSNWAGVGHMTHLPISWPGYLMAAGLSWNSEQPEVFQAHSKHIHDMAYYRCLHHLLI